MNEIKLLQTSIIMIFPTDDLHLSSIKRSESLSFLKERFKLELLKVPENIPIPLNNLIFRDGEFSLKNKVFLIPELVFEDRRMILKIQSDSSIADTFFNELRKTLKEIDIRDDKGEYTPLLTTYETICVCSLDFDFNKLFSNSFQDYYLKDINDNLPKYGAKHSIIPASIKLRIDYFDLPDKLRKDKITLTDKYIVIELRERTNPEDKIFYTTSPTNTATHFELLKNIEKQFN